ncbi:FAS1 domain-containing protein [Helicostylum pulchrum]|nr:FAS1 domain-containing protein [Helicostylum pulchrum]
MGEKLLYEPNAPDYKAAFASQSLFDKLAPDPSLSTFMDVLTQVDDIFRLLNNSDSQNGQFTVFCPVNSAFRNELDVYTRAHLDEFLRNHVVPNNKLDPETLKRIQYPLKTMLRGQTIKVKHHFFSQRTVLNDHAIVDTKHAVEAVNGIAYKIDHLLRPTK